MELQALLDTYPNDSKLLADSTIIANWAGDDALALELYSRDHTPKDDASVIEAAARSARNLRRFDLAIELYRHSAALSPERWQSRLGEGLVLIDQGDTNAASALLQPLLHEHERDVDVLVGNAYLCDRQKDPACVLAMEERLLSLNFKTEETQCRMAQALSALGAEALALQQCPSIGSETGLRLIAGAGAEGVRWGEAYAAPDQQKKDTEQALARLDGVIAGSSAKDPIWRQAEYDRLVALSHLQRMRDVTLEYERLQGQKISWPPYVLQIVANAYLSIRRPELAESLYEELMLKSPRDGELWSSLAYAQLEEEHIGQAFNSVDHAYAETPAWLRAPDLKESQRNPLHTRFGLQAAKMRGYVGLLADEESRLTGSLALAPASIDARRQLAMTYLARGWPLRAIEQERIADNYAQPDELPSLETAEIYEAAGRRNATDAILPALLERDGRAPAIQKFLRERAIVRGWQLDVSDDANWSSGAFIGNSDQHNEAHLYSPFIRNSWRIFGHEWFDNGNFAQGNATRSRFGAGVSYSYERQSLWGEVASDTGSADTTIAGSLGGSFGFGDHLTLRAEANSDNSAAVPLIATLGGIRARGLDANLAWRANELRGANLGVQRLLFTDGDQRFAVSGAWEQQVHTSPRLRVNISPQVWTSSNSKDENRAYFNPKRDFSIGPRSTLEWITWRRYDRSLRQEISGYVAPYWQHSYATGTAGIAGYTQRWKLGNRFGFFCGVTWNSQPYNGGNESYASLKYGLTLGAQ